MNMRHTLGLGSLQNLYLSNLSVISLGGFFEEMLIFGHLLLIWERDTVDTLQGVVFGVTKEVRSGVLI